MRHADIDTMMVMERRRDELAEAEHYRLVKLAEAANLLQAAPKRHFKILHLVDPLLLTVARILSFMGGHMLDWSCRLQYRYSLLAGGAAENQSSPCA